MIASSFFFLLLTAVLNAAIGHYVWRQTPRSAAHTSFSFLAVAIALWTLGIAFAHHTDVLTDFFARLTFFAASLLPSAVLLVFSTFPNQQRLALTPTSKLLVVLCPVFALLSLSPAIVVSATREAQTLRVVYGSLHPLYGVYVVVTLVWSFRTFLPRYLASSGLTRLQFRYFLLGLLVPTVGVTITNLILPLISRSSRSGQYGPYFVLIFLACAAHALIRYRLMDIRLVIRRWTVFVLAMTTASLLLATTLGLLSFLLRWDITSATLVAVVLLSTLLTLLLQPLRLLLERWLNSYAYRVRADYATTLRQASQALNQILDFDSLVSFIAKRVLEATHTEFVTLYVARGATYSIVAEASHFEAALTSRPSVLSSDSPFVRSLGRLREPLVAEELSRRAVPERDAIHSAMIDAHWAAAIPLLSERHLLGIMCVGPKLSRDAFFTEDVDLLLTITTQASIALANSQLYREVVLANQYVANVLATIDSGVIAIDATGSISLFNSAAERLTGLRSAEMLGLALQRLPSPLATMLQATIADSMPQLQRETTLIGPSGNLVPLVCSTAALRDNSSTAPGSSTTLGAVLVFSDLSNLKELEAQKARAERLASFTALASGLAHEIKNPLVAIRTFAELLPERFTDEEFRGGFSKVVLSEISRIDDLVVRLRGLAAPVVPKFALLDVCEPLDDTFALLRGHFDQKHISTIREYMPVRPPISGNHQQLKQLFLNVMMNAIEAMSPEGTLSVAVSTKSQIDSSVLVVRVCDTGTGIDPKVKNQMFNPFVTSKPTGSGLGLAISRGIADAHSATITATNNDDGVGATVTIEFPIASVASSGTLLEATPIGPHDQFESSLRARPEART